MSISIDKRTRATINDSWSEWAVTTDAPPYVNTTTVEYRVASTSTPDISELTSGELIDSVWSGTGVFDKLMFAVSENIRGEFEKGRLRGTDYATVYVGSIQSVIAQSISYLLQAKASEDKLLSGVVQREVMAAQRDLYERQKNAFDDNKYQKLFETQLNYNGMIFQDATDPDVLNVGLEQKVNDVFNRIITSSGSRVDEVTQNEVTPLPEV